MHKGGRSGYKDQSPGTHAHRHTSYINSPETGHNITSILWLFSLSIQKNPINSWFITMFPLRLHDDGHQAKVSKGAKIRNRYNQVPHLTQDTNGKVIDSQLDTTNESQEVSPFPAGDHSAHINRRIQMHIKHKTDPQKKYRLGTFSKIFYWRA